MSKKWVWLIVAVVVLVGFATGWIVRHQRWVHRKRSEGVTIDVSHEVLVCPKREYYLLPPVESEE